jgi:hypothetical protein
VAAIGCNIGPLGLLNKVLECVLTSCPPLRLSLTGLSLHQGLVVLIRSEVEMKADGRLAEDGGFWLYTFVGLGGGFGFQERGVRRFGDRASVLSVFEDVFVWRRFFSCVFSNWLPLNLFNLSLLLLLVVSVYL